jgi:hypothetical protein
MAKALGLRQSITDGALYSPALVPYYRGKKPGLHTLANLWTRKGGWKANGGGLVRGWQPLGGRDWAAEWDELSRYNKLHDDLALKHIKDFWQGYGLEFDFAVKHKAVNASRRASYFNKGDYLFIVRDKDTGELTPAHSVRGCPKELKPMENEHPKITLLRNSLEGKDEFPATMTYTRRGGLLKVGGWKRLQASPTARPEQKALMPGDNLPDKVLIARFNNLHMPLNTVADLKKRLERERWKRDRLLFERYSEEGIAAVLEHMAADKL